MVLKDDHLSPDKRAQDSAYKFIENISKARFFDRLAAFVVDYSIILSPLVWLLLSPFKKQLGLYSLTGESFLNNLVFINIYFVLLSLSFLYTFLFTATFGATLGQIFFKLKVRSISTQQKITLYDCFVRSLVFNISLLLLGLPFLFTYLNKAHRGLHELVSDTYTYSLVSNKPIIIQNFKLRRACFFVASVFMFIISTAVVKSYLEATTVHTVEVESDECEEVTEILSSWPSQKEIIPKRLSVAMALYAIDGMGKSCLQKESDVVFASGEESELGYLAKAFVYAGEAKRSDKYLDKVCALSEESEACKIAQVIDGWATDNYDSVNEVLASLDSESAYVNLWKTRFYMSEGNYINAIEAVNRVPKVKAMSRFSSVNKIKLYWFLRDYKSSELIFDSVLENGHSDDSLEMSQWMCGEQLQISCSQVTSNSCKYLSDFVANNETELGLAYIQKLSCEGEMGTYSRFSWTEEAQLLIEYLNTKNTTSEGLISFVESYPFLDKEVPFYAMAKHINSNFEVTSALIEKLITFTKSIKMKYQKTKISERVLSGLLEQKLFTQSLKYGQQFIEGSSQEYKKNLVISSYLANKIELSKEYLKKLDDESQKTEQPLRGLASKDTYQDILKLLNEEEE